MSDETVVLVDESLGADDESQAERAARLKAMCRQAVRQAREMADMMHELCATLNDYIESNRARGR